MQQKPQKLKHTVKKNSDEFDKPLISQSSHLCGLLDDAVPHLIGQKHVFFYKVLLDSLISLSPDHIAYCLVERVHLQTQSNNLAQ